MNGNFILSITPPAEGIDTSLWFVFRGRKMLVKMHDSGISVPESESLPEIAPAVTGDHYLGSLGGKACYGAELPDETDVPRGFALQSLWGLYDHLDGEIFKVALRAIHILEWNRSHQFCSRCGAGLVQRTDVRAKECPSCGLMDFPRISPAVIVLVERGDEVLLARASRFEEELYSVLAGFVEPGETLEETVRREIKEEVGIEVADIRYFGSQPWPFPDSLMIGFTARYAGGDICLEDGEIAAAQWFRKDSLPKIPGTISISRALIDWFVTKTD